MTWNHLPTSLFSSVCFRLAVVRKALSVSSVSWLFFLHFWCFDWTVLPENAFIIFVFSVFVFSLLIIPCLQLICYWFQLIHFSLVLVLLRCWRRLGSLKCRFQRQRKTPILFPIVVKTERERFGFSFVLDIENNNNNNNSKRRNSSDNNKNKGWYNNRIKMFYIKGDFQKILLIACWGTITT